MTERRFVPTIAELEAEFGAGVLTIGVEFDQVYAKYQELRDDLKHPRGGQAHYCRDGLFLYADTYMEQLARGLIDSDGVHLVGPAIRVADEMGRNMENLAPVEFANLRRSAHNTVTDDGVTVYDRPPDVPRLSEEQLRDQRKHGHKLDYGKDTRPRL